MFQDLLVQLHDLVSGLEPWQQVLALVPAGCIGGDIARQALLKGARQVPPEEGGGDAILGFRQVFAGRARLKEHAGAAALPMRVDA